MKQQSFDAVVVGCGIAGLSAAVAATEGGARVAVLERSSRDERGGQSRYTEAYLRMKSKDAVSDDFETHFMNNVGYYQYPDLLAEMALDRSSWSQVTRSLPIADTAFLEAFAANVPPTIRWLEERGVRFDFLPTQFLTRSVPRLLPVGGGQAIVEALAARAEKLGVTFFYHTTARDLIVDEPGKVGGVLAVQKDVGGLGLTGDVVLACGGFEGNPQMLAKYLGPRSVYLRPVCRAGYFNKGEGIEMALRIGAAPCGEFGSYHAEPVDPRSGISEPSVFIFPYGILVNKNGERFADEAPGTVDAHYERVTRRIYEQPEGIAYVVLDQRLLEIPNYKLGLRTDQPPYQGATVAELAAAIGVPAERLERTVSDYNRACVPGPWRPLELDGLATRGLAPQKSNWAHPLTKGPYLAYPIVSSNVFTFGGLKIDGGGHVLDTDGERIDGLYAAGEIVGTYYGTYTGATSVLKGMTFGRLSGEDIAARKAAR